ncbi:hypothetical protein BJX62DRAFT_237111 [Aspergillus germanicus]
MTFCIAATGISNETQLVCRDILKTLSDITMGPRVSSELILQQMTRTRWKQLSQRWKVCFIAYGRSITALQRAKRLLSFLNHPENLVRELQNPGHTNWDPMKFPETLLLEIENGILIRDVQDQIADQMRNIHLGHNAVMRLNMGEGKSLVIVPIVAAALADGSCLVRVLVAKPQSQQIFHMLVSKLGGLLDRRVYHLPVSRALLINEPKAKEIERICLGCTREGGILLVQPEHLLSLKLMSLECLIKGKDLVGKCLLSSLNISGPRPAMTLRSLEYSPHRWVLIQQVLDLVRKYAPAIQDKYPDSIELDEQSQGSFPHVRLLHVNTGMELARAVADHICHNGIDSLPVSRQPEVTRKAVLTYILQSDLSEQEVAIVENGDAKSLWTATTKEPLLLRGLFAGGVLAFCLGQKRWRVNYGPAYDRKPPTKLSVPYWAKDKPIAALGIQSS